jgi:LysM repeat protein
MDLDRRQFGRVVGVTLGSLALGGATEELLGATEVSTYRVKRGDTLSAIAKKFNSSVSELKELNGLSSVHRIRAGQRLKLSESASISAGIPRKLRWQIGHNDVQKKRWTKIIVHHSATDNGNAAIFNGAHLRRGMVNGLAYHFVIGNGTNSTRDGEIEIGNRWKRQLQGGHVRKNSLNQVSVGICLVGNFEKRRPSAKQLASLNSLTHFLQRELLSGRPKVYGHKDLERNLCPGKFFPLTAYRKRFAWA